MVVLNIFYFHPYLGKIPNLTNIFQMGCNHQPVTLNPFRSFSGPQDSKKIPRHFGRFQRDTRWGQNQKRP